MGTGYYKTLIDSDRSTTSSNLWSTGALHCTPALAPRLLCGNRDGDNDAIDHVLAGVLIVYRSSAMFQATDDASPLSSTLRSAGSTSLTCTHELVSMGKERASS